MTSREAQTGVCRVAIGVLCTAEDASNILNAVGMLMPKAAAIVERRMSIWLNYQSNALHKLLNVCSLG